MILITGGIRSGKSSYALTLARRFPSPRAFIATAAVTDAEMAARIARHQEERGTDFILFEEETAIWKPLKTARASVLVVDCVTLWVNNLLHHGWDVEAALESLLDAVSGHEVFVTNEVGAGIAPDNALARRYVDALGMVNKALAAKADTVYLMVAGLPVKVKG